MKDSSPIRRRAAWAAGALFLLWAFALYGIALDAPLYLDDFSLMSPPGRSAAENAGREVTFDNRRLAEESFKVLNRLFDYAVAPQRALNILLHALTALGLFLLFRDVFRLLRTEKPPGEETDDLLAPFLAASLFLVDPALSQPVIYLIQRMTLMAAGGAVWSLYLYGRSRLAEGRSRRLALRGGSLALFGAALLSKESAVVLLPLLFFYELLLLRKRKESSATESLLALAPHFLLAGAAVVYYLGNIRRTDPQVLAAGLFGALPGRRYTGLERWFSQGRVLFYYASLWLFPLPSRLSLEHDFSFAGALGRPVVWAAWAFVGLAAAYALKGRRKRPTLFLGLAWFALALLPESTLLNLAAVFEQRLYLPAAGLALAASRPLAALVRRPGGAGRRSRRGAAPAVLLLLILSAGTAIRADQWNHRESFLISNLKHSPNNLRAHTAMAQYLEAEGRSDEAFVHFEKAARLAPESSWSRYNLGVACLRREEYGRAAAELETAARLAPRARTYAGLGKAYQKLGRLKDAEAALREGLRLAPEDAEMPGVVGGFLLETGRPAEALPFLEEAARLEPDSPDLLSNLGAARMALGRPKEAVDALARAAARAPDSAAHWSSYGAALQGAKRYDAAEEAYRKALQLAPGDLQTMRNLATLMLLEGKNLEGAGLLEEIVGKDPAFGAAWENLAAAYYRLDRPQKALRAIEEARRAGRTPDPRLEAAIRRAFEAQSP